jgi:hypothetical protein
MKKPQFFLVFTTILFFSLPLAGAHIIGPEIIPPSESGWVYTLGETAGVVRDVDYLYGGGYAVLGETGGPGEVQPSLVRLLEDGTLNYTHSLFPAFTGVSTLLTNWTYNAYIGGLGPEGPIVACHSPLDGSEQWSVPVTGITEILDLDLIRAEPTSYSTSQTASNGIFVLGPDGEGHSVITSINETTKTVRWTTTSNASRVLTNLAVDPIIPTKFYAAGVLQGDGGAIGVLRCLDARNGTILWERVLDLPDPAVRDLQVDPITGAIIAVGSYAGRGRDLFIYPVREDNTLPWDFDGVPYFSWGGSGDEEATGLVLLGEYSLALYVTGSTTSWGAGQKDLFSLKITDRAEVKWEKLWGTALDDEGLAVTGNPGVAVVCAGVSGGRGVIVENPATDVPALARLAGSNTGVYVLLAVAFGGTAAIVACTYLVFRIRRQKKLDQWAAHGGENT